ncbi:MAG: DNA repair protein RecO [Myxococcota bacterium]|jgi:DNA repair protein RecO (recombination protein O)|nr:DNA repair protein RecO [Myxococcota bacterium]
MASTVDRGIVLDRVPYGEHDVVVQLLTHEHGRLALFARGARRRVPRFGARLEPYCDVECEWRAARGRGLGSLMRVELQDDRRGLQRELPRLLLAAYASEAVRETCPEGAPVPEIHLLLDELQTLLCQRSASPALWAAFSLQLLDRLGYGPELDGCVGCGTPVPQGRPVRVEPGRGGILCQVCRGGAPSGLLLGGAALESLRLLRRVPLGAAEPTLDEPAQGQLRALLPGLLQTITGRPLRSLALLPFGAATAPR